MGTTNMVRRLLHFRAGNRRGAIDGDGVWVRPGAGLGLRLAQYLGRCPRPSSRLRRGTMT